VHARLLASPLFTSSQNGPQNFTRDFWRQLYAAGADVVLNGHDHVYERFGCRTQTAGPIRRADPRVRRRHRRRFLYQFPIKAANSEVQLRAFGLLKLTLNSDSYDYQFIEVGGFTRDSGSAQCH
jgi:hypothetical protein